MKVRRCDDACCHLEASALAASVLLMMDWRRMDFVVGYLNWFVDLEWMARGEMKLVKRCEEI